MGIFPDYLEDKSIFDEKEFFDGNRFKFYEFALFLYEEFHGCYIDNRPHVFTGKKYEPLNICLLYTSPSPRDKRQSRMPSSA